MSQRDVRAYDITSKTNGKVKNLFQKQLKHSDDLSLICGIMKRYWMTIIYCPLLSQAYRMGTGYFLINGSDFGFYWMIITILKN